MKELNKEPVTIRVQFVEDRDVVDADGKVSQSFKKDEIHELPEASANHWISRKAAIRVEDPDEKKAANTKVGMGKPLPPAKGTKVPAETPLPEKSPKPDALKSSDINKP